MSAESAADSASSEVSLVCVRSGAVGVRPPSGTVTFLFTDVVGSTGLWEQAPEAMSEAIARHDALLHAVIDAHDGYVFATGGDGLAAAAAGRVTPRPLEAGHATPRRR